MNRPVAVVPHASPSEEQPRYQDGWRRGKPEEDPEKLKRWGWISARPSEFLVRMRGGRVIASGQGATVYKWPWDSVAIVPTTVQRLTFTADQVTREKVGVKVTGLAVYRIADPLIAFRMLNFSFPERAQEKLARMLEEMCTGASRRLIANLSVEACLTERKEALARELIRELAPVVEGRGQVEDGTDRGWGVVIDTVEIQDVRVLSAQVFSTMQAPFRLEQERRAREAELAKEAAVSSEETGTRQRLSLLELEASTELAQRRVAAQEAARLEEIHSGGRVEAQRLAGERAQKQAQLTSSRELSLLELSTRAELAARTQAANEARAAEELRAGARLAQERQKAREQEALEAVEAEARLKEAQLRAAMQALALEEELALARHRTRLVEEARAAEILTARLAQAEAQRAHTWLELERVRLEVERQALVAGVELDRAEREKAIENRITPEVIQLRLAEKLPEVARAFQQKMGQVNVTAIDGANPYGYIAAAVEGVMGLARSAGLTVKEKSVETPAGSTA